jgi:hypothetical protein
MVQLIVAERRNGTEAAAVLNGDLRGAAVKLTLADKATNDLDKRSGAFPNRNYTDRMLHRWSPQMRNRSLLRRPSQTI